MEIQVYPMTSRRITRYSWNQVAGGINMPAQQRLSTAIVLHHQAFRNLWTHSEGMDFSIELPILFDELLTAESNETSDAIRLWMQENKCQPWFKHMVTFANWLPYIVRKVERHTGRTIELTPLERKLPLIFLWPRAIHVLLTRPRREIERK